MVTVEAAIKAEVVVGAEEAAAVEVATETTETINKPKEVISNRWKKEDIEVEVVTAEAAEEATEVAVVVAEAVEAEAASKIDPLGNKNPSTLTQISESSTSRITNST